MRQVGMHQVGLCLRVFWELVRYDVRFALRGMRCIETRRMPPRDQGSASSEKEICDALRAVAPFYWKPVRCLQRSVVTARVMRGNGIPADIVIGYRAKPFFSHAWVEVAGRVVNDSVLYQKQFQVLERL